MKKEYINPNIMIQSVCDTDILTESPNGIGLQNDKILDYNEIWS